MNQMVVSRQTKRLENEIHNYRAVNSSGYYLWAIGLYLVNQYSIWIRDWLHAKDLGSSLFYRDGAG